ncbi:MAG: phosphate ABC transporter substrate-binding protein [Planctomycetota bacterium]
MLYPPTEIETPPRASRAPSGTMRARMQASAAALAILFVGSLLGCGKPPSTDTITITGSSTLAPLTADVARHFESLHPQTRVDVQTGGSSRGLADVRRGLADIGMVSRALTASESDLHGYQVAIDGICLIVHADNPIDELDRTQVQRIFTGDLQNWAQLGGADGPITTVSKAEGRSTLEVFCAFFDLHPTAIDARVVIGDNQHGIKAVAASPSAVGYVSIGAAEAAIRGGVPIRVPRFEGIEPSTEVLATGTYPIARSLHLVTAAEPSGNARAFIDYYRSETVTQLLERHYLVDVDPQ